MHLIFVSLVSYPGASVAGGAGQSKRASVLGEARLPRVIREFTICNGNVYDAASKTIELLLQKKGIVKLISPGKLLTSSLTTLLQAVRCLSEDVISHRT